MTRRQLRGGPLNPDCRKAKTVKEDNGDCLCGGLHKNCESFFLFGDDIIPMCKACGAWHINWRESSRNTHRGW